MSKKTHMKPVVAAIGAALAGSLAMGSATAADNNPFGLSELGSGYMQLAGTEGKCGEGKCGGEKAESEEGKTEEGKCGEGKCGEGKCGGDKAASEDKSNSEGKCGSK